MILMWRVIKAVIAVLAVAIMLTGTAEVAYAVETLESQDETLPTESETDRMLETLNAIREALTGETDNIITEQEPDDQTNGNRYTLYEHVEAVRIHIQEVKEIMTWSLIMNVLMVALLFVVIFAVSWGLI